MAIGAARSVIGFAGAGALDGADDGLDASAAARPALTAERGGRYA
jgi:hypothetical protein